MTTKNIILILGLFAALFHTPLQASNISQIKEISENVPYTILNGYFTRNDWSLFGPEDADKELLITGASSEADFGIMAGTTGMGPKIDFSKQFVILVVGKESDISTDIIPKSLERNAGELSLSCEIKKGAKLSYTRSNSLFLLVDNKYKGKLNLKIMDNEKTASTIPFKIAEGYFTRNDWSLGPKSENEEHEVGITGAGSAEDLFRMAGTTGNATPIDFSKEFVILVAGEVTDINTEILPQSLDKKENELVLSYKLKKGDKLSYKMAPALFLIVDNKYRAKLSLKKVK